MIVEFTSGPVPDYSPFGGIDQFNLTFVTGGKCIGEWLGSAPLPDDLTEYTGIFPPPVYRTQVTPEEFIGLFTNEQWGEVVLSADVDVIEFRTRLQNYKKTFNTEHSAITDGMTEIVQATDITMSGPEALEIVKGVLV